MLMLKMADGGEAVVSQGSGKVAFYAQFFQSEGKIRKLQALLNDITSEVRGNIRPQGLIVNIKIRD